MQRSNRLTQIPHFLRNLQQASRIAGYKNLSLGALHVFRLPLPKVVRRFRFDEVINARRSAADIALRQLDQFQAWNRFEQTPRRCS